MCYDKMLILCRAHDLWPSGDDLWGSVVGRPAACPQELPVWHHVGQACQWEVRQPNPINAKGWSENRGKRRLFVWCCRGNSKVWSNERLTRLARQNLRGHYEVWGPVKAGYVDSEVKSVTRQVAWVTEYHSHIVNVYQCVLIFPF